MTTTVAWTPLLKPDLVSLVAVHAHSPLMMDPDIYLSSLSTRIQRMVNASPDPKAAVREFQETLFQESMVSEVPYCPTEEAGNNLICSNSRVWDILSNMGVFQRMPVNPPLITNLMAHQALSLDLDDPVGRLKSWASRMAREA
jgi:hypothetical protein